MPNLLPAGSYEARLVLIGDCGQVEDVFQGKSNGIKHKIGLGFELIDKKKIMDNGVELAKIIWTQPFNTFGSLTERGKETEFYRVFDPSAVVKEIPNWKQFLNTPCTVTIFHDDVKGVMREAFRSVAPIPDKYHSMVGEAVTPQGVCDAYDDSNPYNKEMFGLMKVLFDRRIPKEKLSA